MSDISDYNEALFAAKLKALQKLRELLRTSTDPVERRQIATAILRFRIAESPAPAPKAPTSVGRSAAPQNSAYPTLNRRTPAISSHALGTLYLNTRSLPIHDGAPPKSAPDDAPAPIQLTPSDEPPIGGGPASLRPLPIPLGPARA